MASLSGKPTTYSEKVDDLIEAGKLMAAAKEFSSTFAASKFVLCRQEGEALVPVVLPPNLDRELARAVNAAAFDAMARAQRELVAEFYPETGE